jgi:DNA-binding transcriptional regulator GbsR (MarR family)
MEENRDLTEKEVKNQILGTFAMVAESIGYSPLHGKIIGVLLVKDRPMSLSEIARETGYSSSMISLSLDFLEVLEVVKKIKKSGDRKLYVELSGDLLSILKKAIVIRVKKSINESLQDFNESRDQFEKLEEEERERVEKTINTLESELERLSSYVNLLSQIELPTSPQE